MLGEYILGIAFCLKPLVDSLMKCNGLQLCGTKILQKMWRSPFLGRRLALLEPVEQCALARSVHLLERSREVWAAWRVLLLPYQEGARGLDRVAVALIGLHLLAAEGEARSRGSQSPELGDMWRHGCPMRPEWISSCSASETSGGEE